MSSVGHLQFVAFCCFNTPTNQTLIFPLFFNPQGTTITQKIHFEPLYPQVITKILYIKHVIEGAAFCKLATKFNSFNFDTLPVELSNFQ